MKTIILAPTKYADNNFKHLLRMQKIIFTAFSVNANKNKMLNISLTLYTNVFFASVLKSPTYIGSLSVNNPVMNISRLGSGTFK